MKTVEEVIDYLVSIGIPRKYGGQLLSAITAYAAERVRQALIDADKKTPSRDKWWTQEIKEFRAEALEEAAKVAISYSQKCSDAAKGREPCEVEGLQLEWQAGHRIAKQIRALKEKS